MPTSVNIPESLQSLVEKDELLVWKKDTWGSFGQHSNLYSFIIDLTKLQQKPVFEVLTTRHVNADSRKNYHRFTYIKIDDLVKLNNVVLKIVSDYKSSRRREIDVSYFYIDNKNIIELYTERNLRDEKGFFDIVYLPDGTKLRVSKDSVKIIN